MLKTIDHYLAALDEEEAGNIKSSSGKFES